MAPIMPDSRGAAAPLRGGLSTRTVASGHGNGNKSVANLRTGCWNVAGSDSLRSAEHDHQLRPVEAARLQPVEGAHDADAGVARETMRLRGEARAVHDQRRTLRRPRRVADRTDLVPARANCVGLGSGGGSPAVSVQDDDARL